VRESAHLVRDLLAGLLLEDPGLARLGDVGHGRAVCRVRRARGGGRPRRRIAPSPRLAESEPTRPRARPGCFGHAGPSLTSAPRCATSAARRRSCRAGSDEDEGRGTIALCSPASSPRQLRSARRRRTSSSPTSAQLARTSALPLSVSLGGLAGTAPRGRVGHPTSLGCCSLATGSSSRSSILSFSCFSTLSQDDVVALRGPARPG